MVAVATLDEPLAVEKRYHLMLKRNSIPLMRWLITYRRALSVMCTLSLKTLVRCCLTWCSNTLWESKKNRCGTSAASSNMMLLNCPIQLFNHLSLVPRMAKLAPGFLAQANFKRGTTDSERVCGVWLYRERSFTPHEIMTISDHANWGS